MGFYGNWTACLALLAFIQSNEEDPPKFKDAGALIIRPKSRMFVYENGILMRATGKYIAGGTGATLALGALHAGASAVEAIQAAIAHDSCTRGPVRSLKLEE